MATSTCWRRGDDAAALLAALGVVAAPGTASDRFRSDRFGRWLGAPLPVEVMGGFHVRAGGDWTRLQPRSRRAVTIGMYRFFTPSPAEMIDICELFGRAKDRERAAGLRALATLPSFRRPNIARRLRRKGV